MEKSLPEPEINESMQIQVKETEDVIAEEDQIEKEYNSYSGTAKNHADLEAVLRVLKEETD